MGSRIPPAHILAVLAWAWVSLGQVQAAPEPLVIPAQGNSWYASADARTDRRILERGIDNWSDLAKPIHTYFWVPNPGTIHISVRARVSTGPSTLRLTLGDTSRTLSLTNTVISRQPVGRFVVPKPGYQRLEVRGLKKSGDAIADIQGFLVSGMPGIRFVRDAFYWSRRGPSVHLKYSIPDGVGDIRYFYSEIRVPKGQDVMGSYFMATGFATATVLGLLGGGS